MSRKLFVNNFKLVKYICKFVLSFIKSYNEESIKYKVDDQCPENLNDFYNDLPLLSEIMKNKEVQKLVANLHDKSAYVAHIRNLKQSLNHGLVLKKKLIELLNLDKKNWLKSFIDVNTDLNKKGKKGFQKRLLKLMNNAVFGKNLENGRKNNDSKLVTIEKRRSYFVSEPNYFKVFHRIFEISNKQEYTYLFQTANTVIK